MAHQNVELVKESYLSSSEQALEDASEGLIGKRVGLFVWCALVVVSIWWGSIAISSRPEFKVEAAPLFGHWGWHLNPALFLVTGTGVTVAVLLNRCSETLSWRSLLVMSAASSVVWSVVLNVGTHGWSSLTASLTDRFQYEPLAASINDVGGFVRNFVEEIGSYPVHVRGHPPGATLVPWVLDRIGLGGAGWLAVVIQVAWGVAGTSVLIATRAVSSEQHARRALPFIALLPGAMWATSADGLFAGVSATAVTLGVVAVVRGRYDFAVAAGVLIALALMLTYGSTPLFVVVVAVAFTFPGAKFRMPAVVAVSAATTLVVIWALTGFSWLDGLEATRKEYWEGVASIRPSHYFVLAGNPGALAIAVGPAVFAGFGALVDQSLKRWRIHGFLAMAAPGFAAVIAVSLANVSLLSKAEVERIWLIFMPWLAVLGATLGKTSRRWVWCQVGTAVALAVVFRR